MKLHHWRKLFVSCGWCVPGNLSIVLHPPITFLDPLFGRIPQLWNTAHVILNSFCLDHKARPWWQIFHSDVESFRNHDIGRSKIAQLVKLSVGIRTDVWWDGERRMKWEWKCFSINKVPDRPEIINLPSELICSSGGLVLVMMIRRYYLVYESILNMPHIEYSFRYHPKATIDCGAMI